MTTGRYTTLHYATLRHITPCHHTSTPHLITLHHTSHLSTPHLITSHHTTPRHIYHTYIPRTYTTHIYHTYTSNDTISHHAGYTIYPHHVTIYPLHVTIYPLHITPHTPHVIPQHHTSSHRAVSQMTLFLLSAECEFETPKICGYTQDSGDDFDWTRGSGNTTSLDTGPSSDHTYGTAAGKLLHFTTHDIFLLRDHCPTRMLEALV